MYSCSRRWAKYMLTYITFQKVRCKNSHPPPSGMWEEVAPAYQCPLVWKKRDNSQDRSQAYANRIIVSTRKIPPYYLSLTSKLNLSSYLASLQEAYQGIDPCHSLAWPIIYHLKFTLSTNIYR